MLRRATALKRICDRQRVQNAIIITMNKIVENFIYSPFCSLYFFINIFAVSKSS